MRIVLILLLIGGAETSHAQTITAPSSPTYNRIGAYSDSAVDVFSFSVNQASLARIGGFSAGMMMEKPLLLNEVGDYLVAFALPTASGSFGFSGRYFGFASFSQSQLGVSYARSLGSRLDLGVQFNFYDERIPGYGTATTVNFEAGILLHLTDNFNAGLHIFNPIPAKLGKDGNERLASVYSAGFGYDVSGKFSASIEVEREEDRPANINAGFQYRLIPELMTRLGISSSTSSIYFGIGFYWHSMKLDVTTTYQPQLGLSPGVALSFTKKSPKK